MKLLNFTPLTAKHYSLMSYFTHQQWEFILKSIYKRANYCCEICHQNQEPVKPYVSWNYNDDEHIMHLEKILTICPNCDEINHLNEMSDSKELNRLLKHFQTINNIPQHEVKQILEQETGQYNTRSKYYWTVDIRNLRKYIESKVPTPKDLMDKKEMVNLSIINIQCGIEIYADENHLDNHEKKILNEVFNRFILSGPTMGYLENNIENQLIYFDKLAFIVDMMRSNIESINQYVMNKFEAILKSSFNPLENQNMVEKIYIKLAEVQKNL